MHVVDMALVITGLWSASSVVLGVLVGRALHLADVSDASVEPAASLRG